jgi:protein subunit release factor A
MLEKLQAIINKYESLREESLRPEIFEDMEKAKKINKELA